MERFLLANLTERKMTGSLVGKREKPLSRSVTDRCAVPKDLWHEAQPVTSK